jgi:hypothetical protein
MIELNSVVVILLIEAIVALLLVLLGLWIWSRKKKSSDFQVAHELIDELDEDKSLRTHKLGKLITGSCALDSGELETLLQDIDVREKALYRQIIQIFLNRDPKVLKAVDKYIQDLAHPYCALLKSVENTAPVAEVPDNGPELAAARQDITRLTEQNTMLAEQLHLALKTADEVSDEYARIFNGSKNELELRASYKRVMYLFQSIEANIKKNQVSL